MDPEDSEINEDELSKSGKESEEHDSDNINFYTDVDINEDEEEDGDDDGDDEDKKGKRGNVDCKDDGMGNARAIEKLERKIKTLRTNHANNLVILQSMISIPNHENPYE